jgi:uncharacterized protein (UPF0335 family)
MGAACGRGGFVRGRVAARPGHRSFGGGAEAGAAAEGAAPDATPPPDLRGAAGAEDRIEAVSPARYHPRLWREREMSGAAAVAEKKDRDDAEVGGIAADRLRSIVERIERLEEERKGLADNIKDIFAEAKSAGFDVKVVRQIISIRKKEPAEVEEQETLLELYRRALGM